MKCDKCGLELMIHEKSRLQFEGDESSETETKAFYDFTYTCRNKNCSNHGQRVSEERVYLT